ncbi:hypothetical protein ACPZRF_20840, partial [Alkalicoccus sp. WONF2802]
RCLVFCLRLRYSRRLRQNTRRYGYRGLKIFTSLALRFQDFQRRCNDKMTAEPAMALLRIVPNNEH